MSRECFVGCGTWRWDGIGECDYAPLGFVSSCFANADEGLRLCCYKLPIFGCVRKRSCSQKEIRLVTEVPLFGIVSWRNTTGFSGRQALRVWQ